MTIYDDAVTEFRQLDESIESGQWRQAELTFENAAPDGTRDGRGSLTSWAKKVGKSVEHIRTLWHMWDDLDPSTRHDQLPPFNETYQRTREGADWEEKQALRRARSAIGKLTPEQKAEVVDDTIDELSPDQQAQVLDRWTPEQERNLRDRLTPGERELANERAKNTERQIREHEAEDGAHPQPRLPLIGDLVRLRNQADDLVARWSGRVFTALTPEENDVFDAELSALRQDVDQIDQFRLGRESLEAEFARMNEGQS